MKLPFNNANVEICIYLKMMILYIKMLLTCVLLNSDALNLIYEIIREKEK